MKKLLAAAGLAAMVAMALPMAVFAAAPGTGLTALIGLECELNGDQSVLSDGFDTGDQIEGSEPESIRQGGVEIIADSYNDEGNVLTVRVIRGMSPAEGTAFITFQDNDNDGLLGCDDTILSVEQEVGGGPPQPPIDR